MCRQDLRLRRRGAVWARLAVRACRNSLAHPGNATASVGCVGEGESQDEGEGESQGEGDRTLLVWAARVEGGMKAGRG